MLSSSRIVSFDVLKSIGIFLVIWGHCLAALGCRSYESNNCFLFIYSFHMPLFMMMAGFFFAEKALNRPFLQILRNKGIQLLLPAITWGFIIACLAFVYRFHRGDTGLHVYFGKSLFATVWFLKCLFLCYMFGRLSSNKTWGYIITIILSQFLPIWKFEIMYPCFVAGVLLNRYLRALYQNWSIIMSVLLAIFIIGYMFLWDASLLQTQYLFLGIVPSHVVLSYRTIRILMGIAASTFLILLFAKIFSCEGGIKNKLSPMLGVGKETLGIYIIQDIIIMGLLSKFLKIGFCGDFVFSMVVTPVLSFIILYLCYWVVKLIKLNDKLSFYLLGVQ